MSNAWLTRIAIVGCMSSATAARADTPLRLREALARAIAGNPTLANSTLVLDESEAAQLAERGRYDAHLEAQATGHAERSQPRISPFAQPLSRDVYGASASIVKPLLDGGEARLTVAAHREDSTTRLVDPASNAHNDFEQRTITPQISATVREPLWGGRAVGPAVRARLAAERDAAALERAATAANVLRDVEHAYWQLYLAQQEVAIRHDASAAAETQLRQVQAEITRGTRPRLAAAEIEDELARRREDELIAAGAVAERSLELARLLGIPPTSDLRATDAVPTDPPATTPAIDAAPQLRAASARVAAAADHLGETRDAARWQLDASLTGSLSAPRDTWHDAIDATEGYGGWTVELGLSLKVPLTERAARGNIAGARARWLEAQVAREDAAAALAAEVERWTNRRDVAKQRRVALERARELAAENLAAEQHRWERGDTTSYEVLRRQAAVSEVRLRYEHARIDELDADTALAALSGELLPRRGIVLK